MGRKGGGRDIRLASDERKSRPRENGQIRSRNIETCLHIDLHSMVGGGGGWSVRAAISPEASGVASHSVVA